MQTELQVIINKSENIHHTTLCEGFFGINRGQDDSEKPFSLKRFTKVQFNMKFFLAFLMVSAVAVVSIQMHFADFKLKLHFLIILNPHTDCIPFHSNESWTRSH